MIVEPRRKRDDALGGFSPENLPDRWSRQHESELTRGGRRGDVMRYVLIVAVIVLSHFDERRASGAG